MEKLFFKKGEYGNMKKAKMFGVVFFLIVISWVGVFVAIDYWLPGQVDYFNIRFVDNEGKEVPLDVPIRIRMSYIDDYAVHEFSPGITFLGWISLGNYNVEAWLGEHKDNLIYSGQLNVDKKEMMVVLSLDERASTLIANYKTD